MFVDWNLVKAATKRRVEVSDLMSARMICESHPKIEILEN